MGGLLGRADNTTMSAPRVSLSMYLDNAFGALLLLLGTGLGALAVLNVLPIEAGILGLLAFGYGKLLCIGAMLRKQCEREVAAFQLGREAGLRSVGHH